MKIKQSIMGIGLFTAALFSQAFAGTPGRGAGQVFFRGGLGFTQSNRAGQVFTDTLGTTQRNNDSMGWNIGAGLNLSLWEQMGPGSILGEILANYSEFSNKTVTQTTSALLAGTNQSAVAVSELAVSVSPKYRFDEILDGKIRPWLIPAGLAFLVNSPPSDDSTYLDVGYHAGLGLEYVLCDQLSAGADFRYIVSFKRAGLDASHGTAAAYIGVNF